MARTCTAVFLVLTYAIGAGKRKVTVGEGGEEV